MDKERQLALCAPSILVFWDLPPRLPSNKNLNLLGIMIGPTFSKTSQRTDEFIDWLGKQINHIRRWSLNNLQVKHSLHLSVFRKIKNHQCRNMEKDLRRFLQPSLFLMLYLSHAKSIQTVNLVDFCGQTIRADGIIVNSHQESQKYYFVTVGTDCRFTMQAISPKDKVHFQFRYFLVYSLLRESSILQPLTLPPLLQRNVTGPLSLLNTSRSGTGAALPLRGEEITDTCNAGSFVQFYDGKDRTSSPIGSLLCGKNIPEPILSTGDYLTLRLVTRGQQPRVDFVGHFTSYRPDDTSILPAVNETSTKTMEHNSPSPSTNFSTFCQTQRRHHHLPSNNIPYLDSAADNKSHVSLLTLYIILGVIAGVALLLWCCWSPGRLVWRLSFCRFLPCCICAACQLCTHSCCRMDKSRLTKVTPQSTVPIPV
ncbi:uncharacterized protein ldlrad2 [Hypanus sabinus]|uniref:uncharacterized protein ldlrad2 n=1 Tax=Hypanus sabinus TaxID=79690 RepID=UPI0028C47958|nr:uncharacterized protein ldlrad2 [Hypanus sabinus]